MAAEQTREDMIGEREEYLRIIDGLSRPNSMFNRTKEAAFHVLQAKTEVDRFQKQIDQISQCLRDPKARSAPPT